MGFKERFGKRSSTVQEDLAIFKSKMPEISGKLDDLEELLNKKLYFEFGEKAKEILYTIFPAYNEPQPIFVEAPADPSTDKFQFFGGVEFVWKIVDPLKLKLRPTTFVEMVILTAEFLCPEDALLWVKEYETYSEKIPRLSLDISRATHLLRCRQLKETETVLEDISKKLEERLDVDIAIHSAFHRLLSSFYKAKNDFGKMYTEGFLFLQYSPMNTLLPIQCQELLRELSIALLLSPANYDFGDMLHHPVASFVQGTADEWLLDFLRAYNEGQMSSFDTAISKHQEYIQQHNLREHLPFLKEKMARMALMEVSFQKTKTSQAATFQEIADVCCVNLFDVERLLIRSMCHNLIQGRIDQIAQHVHIDWVKPRVLDNPRLDLLLQHVENWEKKTSATVDFLEAKTEGTVE